MVINFHFISGDPSLEELISTSQHISLFQQDINIIKINLLNTTFDTHWTGVFFKNYDTITNTFISYVRLFHLRVSKTDAGLMLWALLEFQDLPLTSH
jgi:hypothetical protein